jgi:hypothetical protein
LVQFDVLCQLLDSVYKANETDESQIAAQFIATCANAFVLEDSAQRDELLDERIFSAMSGAVLVGYKLF